MSKFHFVKVESALLGATYTVEHEPSGKTIGTVSKAFGGWVVMFPWAIRADEYGYRTRNAAAERLLLVAGVNPAAWSALPSDPFEGVSA